MIEPLKCLNCGSTTGWHVYYRHWVRQNVTLYADAQQGPLQEEYDSCYESCDDGAEPNEELHCRCGFVMAYPPDEQPLTLAAAVKAMQEFLDAAPEPKRHGDQP